MTDSRTGALGVTFQYDVEGRLSKTFQTSTPAEGATYKYDARSRLASRVVTHAVAPLSTTTLYIHDLDDHIIAETDASGTTLREYIWVDDLPLAIVANANVAPAIYYVHTDHLLRPARMTDNVGAVAWDVIYKPFGEVNNVAIISAAEQPTLIDVLGEKRTFLLFLAASVRMMLVLYQGRSENACCNISLVFFKLSFYAQRMGAHAKYALMLIEYDRYIQQEI